MKTEEKHINYIKSAFEKMQTKEDLLNLMNYAKPIIYGEKTIPFDLKQLTYYAHAHKEKSCYTEFKIKKKSGGERSIHAPVSGLKAIQKTLALILEYVFVPHPAAKGFVREKSIVDNAKVHIGNYYVYNIDLKDFFQSIDQARVWSCLQLSPFNLKNTRLSGNGDYRSQTNLRWTYLVTVRKFKSGWFVGRNAKFDWIVSRDIELQPNTYVIVKEVSNGKYYTVQKMFSSLKDTFVELDRIIKNSRGRQEIADLIANLCCTKMNVERQDVSGIWQEVSKNVLPQGAPTSPVLTNVVCQRLDFLLSAVARRFGLKYSRYADDITFSSLHNVFLKDSEFLKEMERVITDQGFTIKLSKTRLHVDGMQKVVTGLVVNDKVNVKKRYVKQLRMWLHYWETYGYSKAEQIFKKDYLKDKGHVKTGEPNLSNVLDGKLNYLQMVKGGNDSTYGKLKDRFDQLTLEANYKTPEKNTSYIKENAITSQSDMMRIVELILSVGIDKAMSKYKE